MSMVSNVAKTLIQNQAGASINSQTLLQEAEELVNNPTPSPIITPTTPLNQPPTIEVGSSSETPPISPQQ